MKKNTNTNTIHINNRNLMRCYQDVLDPHLFATHYPDPHPVLLLNPVIDDENLPLYDFSNLDKNIKYIAEDIINIISDFSITIHNCCGTTTNNSNIEGQTIVDDTNAFNLMI